MAPRKPTTTIAKKMAETRKTAAGGRKKPRVVMQNARAKPVPAVDAGNTHTILLIQETKNKATRTWSDYNSLNEVCIEALRPPWIAPRVGSMPLFS
eukprot:scaffold81106_cov31-Tisochrysis_lutea.AAC.3